MALRSKSDSSQLSSPSSSIQWEDAPTELTRRNFLMEISGDTGTGRTTFALTAPGPIAFFHAMEKTEGIVQPAARIKKIRMFNFGGIFRGSEDQIKEQAGRMEKEFLKAWYDAFNWARTIILDTDTEAYQLSRLAEFGALKPSGGRIERNWEGVNARWGSLLNSARAQDRTSVIMIGQTEDEWTKPKGDKMGSKTGKTVRSGQSKIPIKADIGIRTFVEIEDGKRDFMIKIHKPWWNSLYLGEELMVMKIPDLLGLMTETDPREWGE